MSRSASQPIRFCKTEKFCPTCENHCAYYWGPLTAHFVIDGMDVKIKYKTTFCGKCQHEIGSDRIDAQVIKRAKNQAKRKSAVIHWMA